MAMPDPQTNLVTRTCGQAAAANPPSYYAALNATFPILRSGLSSSLNASTYVPTSYQPIHVLVHCRDYLSFADCLTCFDAAVPLIAICYPSSKSYVVFDGCSLGYQSRRQSYKWTTTNRVGPLKTQCDGRRTNEAAAFRSTVEAAVEGLVRQVPGRKSLFGATKIGGGNGLVQVYAVAQCLVSGGIIEPVDCGRCLQSASKNVKDLCLPDAGGRSVMMECFLRFSDQPFFNASKVDILLDTPTRDQGN